MANYYDDKYKVFEVIDKLGDPYYPLKTFRNETKAMNYCNDLNYDYGVRDRFYVHVTYDPSALDQW